MERERHTLPEMKMNDLDKKAIEFGMPIKLEIVGVPTLYLRDNMDVDTIMKEMYPGVTVYSVTDLRNMK